MPAPTAAVARPTAAHTPAHAPAPVGAARILTGICVGVHVAGGGAAFGATALIGAASSGMSHAGETFGPATSGWSFGSLAVVTAVLGLLFFGQAVVDGWVLRMLGAASGRRRARVVAIGQPAVTRLLLTVAITTITGDATAVLPGVATAVLGAVVWSLLLCGPASSRRWFAAPRSTADLATHVVPVPRRVLPALPSAAGPRRGAPSPGVAPRPVVAPRPSVVARPDLRPRVDAPTAVLARIPAPRTSPRGTFDGARVR